MTEQEPKLTINGLVISDTAEMCPFTKPQGKRVGDALIALMFIIVPLSLLIYFALLLL